VINSHFVFLAAALSLLGAAGYIRDTLRGVTAPHRVTWGLWGVEGVLAFVVEVQQHVGLVSLMTLMFGVVPLLVFAASFANGSSAWAITTFDVVCGAISLLGIAFWLLVNEPTVALVAFVVADQVAGLPTLRKSWTEPSSESWLVFLSGVANTALTLLAVRHVTTAAVLFPAVIFVNDLVLVLVLVLRVGPRWRHVRSLRGASVA
jgi:hypothetical protein